VRQVSTQLSWLRHLIFQLVAEAIHKLRAEAGLHREHLYVTHCNIRIRPVRLLCDKGVTFSCCAASFTDAAQPPEYTISACALAAEAFV
jgi:hypothetical protein